MKIKLFDFKVPAELIAQEPCSPPDHCRLMVLERKSGKIRHCFFYQIVDYFQPGDCLVLNDTRVIKARLRGERKTSGKVEVFLLRCLKGRLWEALIKPGRKAKVGEVITFKNGIEGQIVGKVNNEVKLLRFNTSSLRKIEMAGEVPLPPYIRAPLKKEESYQTVYARVPGSVAAPTAGLHFTSGLLDELKKRGVKIARVTLHIGLDTFQPIRVEDVEEHTIHREHLKVSEKTVKILDETRREGGRVFACGTTVVRALETVALEGGSLKPFEGETSLYIYPGFRFKVVDALITNFHYPRSTLILLVSAFAGRYKIMKAYREAVKLKYRFFSFGDAMLII